MEVHNESGATTGHWRQASTVTNTGDDGTIALIVYDGPPNTTSITTHAPLFEVDGEVGAPEPCTFVPAGVGGLALLLLRRHRA